MKKINFPAIKAFIKRKKKIIIPAAVLLLIVLFFAFRSPKSDVLNIQAVEYADLKKSVRATGQVISNTDLNLSFSQAGVVKSVRVNVGDSVTSGQILATLDQGQAFAKVTEARGALLGAKAKYNKTLEGASGEDIALAEVSLKNAEQDLVNAKSNQSTIVNNLYQTLLNSSLAAFSVSVSDTRTAPTISGTYVLGQEGEIKISTYSGGSGSYFNTYGLVNSSGLVNSATPEPIGASGLYIQFPSTFYNGEWIVPIPNKKSTTYLTNYNAYKNGIENQAGLVGSAQAIVNQKQAELNLKKAATRSTDLEIAEAEVLSAEGSLQAAQALYEDTIIRAGASATVTRVDIKYGELSEAGKPVITLQDVGNLYIEALINEANIAYLKNGQAVAITFDAFGGDKKFTGIIAHIDPSADTDNGVVNYKIKVSLNEKDIIIRPGMNANIDVSAGERPNVLAIPNAAIERRDGKSFVHLVTDEKKKSYVEREVQTGFIGDNNLVEIVAGLQPGEKIALTKN